MKVTMQVYVSGTGTLEDGELALLEGRIARLQKLMQEMAELGVECHATRGEICVEGAEFPFAYRGAVGLPDEPPINDALLGELEELWCQLRARKGFKTKREWVLANLGLFKGVTPRQLEALKVYFLESDQIPTYAQAGRSLGITGGRVSDLLHAAFNTAAEKLEERLFEWAQGLPAEQLLEQSVLVLGTDNSWLKQSHPEVATVSDFCRLDEEDRESALHYRKYARFFKGLLDSLDS